jgi:hypothetical protein
MPVLITLVPIDAPWAHADGWIGWLRLTALLLPLVALAWCLRPPRGDRTPYGWRTRRPHRPVRAAPAGAPTQPVDVAQDVGRQPGFGGRALLRWPVRFPITLYLLSARGGNGSDDGAAATPRAGPPFAHGVLAGVVLDISAGGMRVQVERPVPVGALLGVDPEDRGPFPLAGTCCRVLRCRPEVGQVCLRLAFVRLSAGTEARIVCGINHRQLGITRGSGQAQDRPRRRGSRGRNGR